MPQSDWPPEVLDGTAGLLPGPLSRDGYPGPGRAATPRGSAPRGAEPAVPVRVGELLPGVCRELVARAADPDRYDRWSRLVASTGNCAQPVRLTGTVHRVDGSTGEVRSSYDTAAEPDGVLLVACRNRRASVCPPCSETYRADTYQLIAAGLRGGKGTPPTVAAHPRVFLTLTAPSFGVVHTIRTDPASGRPRRCHERREAGFCPHGRRTSCSRRHPADDPDLGTPLCGDCYDYTGAVLFNALAPELWRRLCIYLRRDLARASGLTVAEFNARVRLRFAKVAEAQRRGLVHLHAVLRLDAATPDADGQTAVPPPGFDAALLIQAVHAAAGRVRVDVDAGNGLRRSLSWGQQLDVRPLAGSVPVLDQNPAAAGGEAPQAPDESAVAAYLAKYVTKATDHVGLAPRRLTVETVAELDPARHLHRMALTGWQLGARTELAELRLRRWAHMLGFRGHVATRSRAYSTTLGALRAARAAWRQDTSGGLLDNAHRPVDPSDVDLEQPSGADAASDPAGEPSVLLVSAWRFAGSGHRTTGDAVLAASAAASARERREAIRLDRWWTRYLDEQKASLR